MCATGLRHAPTVRGELSQISRGPSRTEARAQDAETIADTLEHLRVRGFLHPKFDLIGAPRLPDQPLLCTLEHEPPLLQQGLAPLPELHVPRAIQPSARGTP